MLTNSEQQITVRYEELITCAFNGDEITKCILNGRTTNERRINYSVVFFISL